MHDDLPPNDLEEPDRTAHCPLPTAHQALGSHDAAIVRMLRAPPRRVHAAERPALAVLERRAAGGAEDVALVEHGGGDLAYGGHRYEPPSPSSAAKGSPQVKCALRAPE